MERLLTSITIAKEDHVNSNKIGEENGGGEFSLGEGIKEKKRSPSLDDLRIHTRG